MASTGLPAQGSDSGDRTRAFRALAGYIFGANEAKTKMSMTTPVFSRPEGGEGGASVMQFVLGEDAGTSAPAPSDPGVRTVSRPGGVFAVKLFGGATGMQGAEARAQELQEAVRRDGLRVKDGEKWWLAQYNDPSTRDWQRRNEVMLELEAFDIWSQQ